MYLYLGFLALYMLERSCPGLPIDIDRSYLATVDQMIVLEPLTSLILECVFYMYGADVEQLPLMK